MGFFAFDLGGCVVKRNQKQRGKNIQSVQRAIDVLNCFDDNNIELSLKEISERLSLNKSTVHGIINTLRNNRYIQQNPNGNYMLGQALFNKSLYAMHASKSRLRSISKNYTIRISNKYKCTTHVFALEGGQLQFLDMTLPINSYYVISTVLHDVMPLYCTASGKIVLSMMSTSEREEYFKNTTMSAYTNKTHTTKEAIIKEIDKIIETGYSIEDEEVEEGCFSVAVPILLENDRLFGTLSVTAPKIKIKDKVEIIAMDLKRASKEISQDLS